MAGKNHYRPRRRNNLTCPACGSGFTATQKSAVYCSPACRQAVSRALRLVKRISSVVVKTNGPKLTALLKGAKKP